VSKTKCPTDEELAAAVEKITAAVRESIPKLKAARLRRAWRWMRAAG
jgi:hypothetical protein